MKTKYYPLIFVFIISCVVTDSVNGQILRRLKQKAEDKIVNKVDKEVDKIGKSKKQESETQDKSTTSSNTPNQDVKEVKVATEELSNEAQLWTKYDFVPGNHVIFWDNLAGEEDGDFPSKWDLLRGNAEIARLNGEKVILFKNGYNDRTGIFPLLEDKRFFAEPLTIEFDIYCGEDFWVRSNYEDYAIKLWEKPSFLQSNHGEGEDKIHAIEISPANHQLTISYGDFGESILEKNIKNKIGWHHIAISLDGRGMKLYFNEHKMLNVPILRVKPTDLNIIASVDAGNFLAIKNIKMASGNIKLQKRIVSEGKYVANGILFETNKATLKPQSYGIIKKIAQLMQDNPTWKFSIEGHTDNVGEESQNLLLSEKRANAVFSALTTYKIEPSRLKTSGKGERYPIADNNTSEGRANNRRVEFILEK